ncbi:MAG: peptide chain release factor N(5)-glutamine methyltransferase [bacterium]|nr:peptide chain release factor N(5)-glutamine methyltransferase [bacterium]
MKTSSQERLGEVSKRIKLELSNHSDAPHLDAERLLLHALKQREPSYLLAHSDALLTEQQISEITRMQDARKTGMPLAYILGEADFYGRTFMVTPDVLIPRPDTEVIIEKALEYIKKNFKHKKEIVIADIGTGSGCIAITLALELNKLTKLVKLTQLATDISQKALDIAKQNAVKHGVLDNIEFLQGDMLEPIKDKHVDLIVSNPPYLPAEALAKAGYTLETRGLQFEPQTALDGGPDGLQFVNQIKASKIPAIIETIGGEIIEV